MLEDAGQGALTLEDAEQGIELRRGGLAAHGAQREPQGRLVTSLEAFWKEIATWKSGVQGSIAAGGHLLDEELEGHVLVGIGATGLLHLGGAP